MPRAAVPFLLALALLAAGCGGSDSETGTAASGSTTETGSAPAQCAEVDAPAPRKGGGAAKPTERLDPEYRRTLNIDTSCGTYVLKLDVAGAPATAASLVSLARSGFFDDTVFHRIVPGFVIQGGDPTQSGSGGPGYSTVDRPPSDASYVKGVVAMAKTQAEPAGTAGSQFFVVTGDDIGLPPDYAIAGTVTKGLDVVELIDTLGDPATEQPLRPVVVRSVTAASAP